MNNSPYTEEEVVYPNLRRCLNENKVSRTEFCRRMGNQPNSGNSTNLRDWFVGRNYPIKRVIDKMIEVTGLTYEELWEVEVAPDVLGQPPYISEDIKSSEYIEKDIGEVASDVLMQPPDVTDTNVGGKKEG